MENGDSERRIGGKVSEDMDMGDLVVHQSNVALDIGNDDVDFLALTGPDGLEDDV